ncbi:MAG: ABC transporter permease [Flavisolibacter sp.]
MKLLTALRSEILKTKRAASFYFTLVIAAFIPAILLLNLLTGGADLKAVAQDPLNRIFELCAERTGIAFLPLFVILVCTLLPQIEYRNNTWKQVFASPQTKGSVFLAKFLNINRLILFFLIANLAFMLVMVVVAHFSNPALHLLHQPFDAYALLLRTVNTYMMMLALCSLQFWLGLRYRNFIIPIAVGLVLWITGMVLIFEESNAVHFFPYSFQVFPLVSKLQPKMAQVAWTSAGYAALFLLLGFLDFRKRRLTPH